MYYESLNFVEEQCTVCHTVWTVAEGHYDKPYICPSCKEEQTLNELAAVARHMAKKRLTEMEDNNGR